MSQWIIITKSKQSKENKKKLRELSRRDSSDKNKRNYKPLKRDKATNKPTKSTGILAPQNKSFAMVLKFNTNKVQKQSKTDKQMNKMKIMTTKTNNQIKINPKM